MEQERLISFANERPMRPNKSGIQRVLDTRDPSCWRFRLSRLQFFGVAAIVLLPNLPLAFFGHLIFLIFPAFVLTILGIVYWCNGNVPTFDFGNGCFYNDRKKPRYGDFSTLKDYLPLKKITAIQLLLKTVYGGKGSRRLVLELNLFTDDLKRVHVADSSDLKGMRNAAKMLSEKLDVPLKESEPEEAKKLKKTPRWVGFIFLFIFGSVGIGGFYTHALSPLIENFNSRNWKEVPAVVVKSRVENARRRSKNGHYTVYRARISYQYRFNGKVYSSENYSAFTRDFSRGSSEKFRIVRNNPPGKKIICFVNPAAPQQAVCSREIPSWQLVLEGGFFLIFFVVGVFVCCLIWKQSTK